MKSLFTDELLTKLGQREKEMAEGKRITVKRITVERLQDLTSELKRYTQESRLSVREQRRNVAAPSSKKKDAAA